MLSDEGEIVDGGEGLDEENVNQVVDGKAPEDQSLRVAVVGCSHGELDIIFETVRVESEYNGKIDLLLCCGDFQAMRNDADLTHFHCPAKYKRLGDFHEYYSGEKEAPCLTIFVGGNHESSAFSMELPNGGWVAKNIYYMGFASVVNFGGLRIGGWSGIFKQNDYLHTHYEVPPFNGGQQVSAYHVRSIEKFRLDLLTNKEPNCIDVFMTHDWPVGITRFGNEERLLRFKPYFKKDIDNEQLGNPFSQQLLPEIRPRHWFAGHLHAKFEATVDHEANESCKAEGQTQFLALHKCTKGNKMYFEIMTIKTDSSLSKELRYDPTWLAILKKTDILETAIRSLAQIPENASDFLPTDEDLKKVDDLFDGDYVIPQNFRTTAVPQNVYKPDKEFFGAHYYRNPQTKEFCEKLQIPDINEQLCLGNMKVVGDPYYLIEHNSGNAKDEGEIQLDLDYGEDEFCEDTTPIAPISEEPSQKRHRLEEPISDVSQKRACL